MLENLKQIQKQPVTMTILTIITTVFLIDHLNPSLNLLEHGTINKQQLTEEPWRIITNGFLHTGLLHLLFNGTFLYIIGNQLEKPLGTKHYIWLYTASLLGGTAGVLLFQENAAGASGALFGLLGAALTLQVNPKNPKNTLKQATQGPIGQMILLNLLFTFLIPGISKGGHLGGLTIGLLFGYTLSRNNYYANNKIKKQTQLLLTAITLLPITYITTQTL